MSSESPVWWNPRVEKECMRWADACLPNEAFGWIYATNHDKAVFSPFPVTATPYGFTVNPQDLVDWAYKSDGLGRVLATFHTHPLSGASFSTSDLTLAVWAEWHVLFVRAGDEWDVRFGRSIKTTKAASKR
ncbi:Mov34/MPN/PAD-1 family protein [Alicyclobacillus herbarius]|uniref:Mov34/MPN/PAD-1 family protein n=1 Tax=Alicyclobacillus herbarius TaxID=122960 RepID=UPI0012DDE165|nr:Mov34/MPN/PAD-1 family protein [Alicyclobacillus herbarius]